MVPRRYLLISMTFLTVPDARWGIASVREDSNLDCRYIAYQCNSLLLLSSRLGTSERVRSGSIPAEAVRTLEGARIQFSYNWSKLTCVGVAAGQAVHVASSHDAGHSTEIQKQAPRVGHREPGGRGGGECWMTSSEAGEITRLAPFSLFSKAACGWTG